MYTMKVNQENLIHQTKVWQEIYYNLQSANQTIGFQPFVIDCL